MSERLFCQVRKEWVSALPEERVRQILIQEMTQYLGYSLGSLALEKQLSQLPHLSLFPSHLLPKRRADLIVFNKPLFHPLLLVECKSITLNNKTLRQLIGYNQFVKACYIAAVNETRRYFGWYDPAQKDYHFQEGIPPYEELIAHFQERRQ